jgi:hypothetical protein
MALVMAPVSNAEGLKKSLNVYRYDRSTVSVTMIRIPFNGN